MGCITSGGISISGNFAEVLPSKPKDFDFESDCKWIEPYPFDVRDVIGGTVCNCQTVEVHYSPWFGFDHYHKDTCYLMQKYRNTPTPDSFWAMQSLPRISFSDKAVPADTLPRAYIQGRSTTRRIKVRTLPIKNTNNLELL